MEILGTICILIFIGSVWASLSEMLSEGSKPLPMKTDWSPETLAAVERKKLREAVFTGKHPDNPLTW